MANRSAAKRRRNQDGNKSKLTTLTTLTTLQTNGAGALTVNQPLINPSIGHTMAETVFRVAWLGVLLGVGAELIMIVAMTMLGKSSNFGSAAADLMQKISWSVFVCVGLAIGLSVSKTKAPAGMLAGLLAAPIAFAVARTLHKSLSQGLGVPIMPGAISPMTMSVLKGIEYALLGGIIAWFQIRNVLRFEAYALSGALIGLVFAGLLLWLGKSAPDQTATGQIAKGINEFLGPLGCTLVQYGAKTMGAGKA